MHQCGISRLYPGTVHPPQYPGRWWDSLYTWDSGFIGMGLAQFSARRGFDCLNAYLTPPGDDEAAFIHHGSLVPAQFYLFAELLNRTQSRALAEYCYPRLMQYYAFFTGQAGGSTTADLQSGLLRPWDYFYNSGGWDDYPPQKAVHEQRLEKRCTPVVTTAHAVRCARILAYTAYLLAHGEDADRLEKDAERFTRALQEHAWDEGAGYFGYVLHDEQGRAAGFLRDASGVNHNMGLGGASPLFAGACTAEQAEGLWEKLASGEHLWSACGLSTVDRSALLPQGRILERRGVDAIPVDVLQSGAGCGQNRLRVPYRGYGPTAVAG
ncbi:MAG: MGH1-like glycoside hydrolase domain-containing protein [Ruthenibacterium lactatiformans]